MLNRFLTRGRGRTPALWLLALVAAAFFLAGPAGVAVAAAAQGTDAPATQGADATAEHGHRPGGEVNIQLPDLKTDQALFLGLTSGRAEPRA